MESTGVDDEQRHIRACAAVLLTHVKENFHLSTRNSFLSSLRSLSSSSCSSSSSSSSLASSPPTAAAAARACAAAATMGSEKMRETAAEAAANEEEEGQKEEERRGFGGKRKRNIFEEIYFSQEQQQRGACSIVTLRPPPPLRSHKISPPHGSDRDTMPPDVKKKLVRRLVLLLLGVMPYAVKHSVLREAVFLEPPLKKFPLKHILKAASVCMRSCLGLLLCKEEITPHSRGHSAGAAEPIYYVSQGVASPANHLQFLRTEREHILRGFLLFLAPCLIACRGVLHATELAVYLTACGREDLLADNFSEASLASLAALPVFPRPNVGASLSRAPSNELRTLMELLLECHALQYLSFSSPSHISAAEDPSSPQPTEIRARQRFVDELSLKEFSREVREACGGVHVPRGTITGEESQEHEHDEEEQEGEEEEGQDQEGEEGEEEDAR